MYHPGAKYVQFQDCEGLQILQFYRLTSQISHGLWAKQYLLMVNTFRDWGTVYNYSNFTNKLIKIFLNSLTYSCGGYFIRVTCAHILLLTRIHNPTFTRIVCFGFFLAIKSSFLATLWIRRWWIGAQFVFTTFLFASTMLSCFFAL